MPTASTLRRRFFPGDLPAWGAFATAIGVLALAFLLALFSAAASEMGRFWLGAGAAITALGMAAWVAITIVPKLARRTSLRWLTYQLDYRLTREGLFYLGAVAVLVLAAVNTGNNLLFLVLSCLLAGILVSGVLSRIVLSGLHLEFELPEHIFAGQAVRGRMELANEKLWLPSFSLSVSDGAPLEKAPKTAADAEKSAGMLSRPIYFPHVAANASAVQPVTLLFPRRGGWHQEGLAISTRFPFGFIEKTRRMDWRAEIIVYPQVERTEMFPKLLALLSGEIAGFYRGRGHELHSLRDYQPSDSARFVSWRASARTGALKVREFAREDERRVIIALDSFCGGSAAGGNGTPVDDGALRERFERAVSVAASMAWHLSEIEVVIQLRTPRASTAMAPAHEIIYSALRELAVIQPEPWDREPAAANGPSAEWQSAEPPGDAAGFLESLAVYPDFFKVIFTGRSRASIPADLWASSHIIFLDSL
jgi:uncharacterized protein (DUF58 family)